MCLGIPGEIVEIREDKGLRVGKVRFAGSDITGVRPHKVADAGLARTFQAVRLFAKLSVRDNLQTAMLVLEDPAHTFEAAERVELLQWLKLDNRLDAVAGGLTLFEQRRLELAMRLMMRSVQPP